MEGLSASRHRRLSSSSATTILRPRRQGTRFGRRSSGSGSNRPWASWCPKSVLSEAHGYVGAVMTSPPRDTFRREVESFRDTGAPPHGAGGAIAWTPTSTLQATTPPQGTAWQYQLQPDLKRGAPEIYRSLRSAGSASVRNWLIISFQGSKQSDKWLELWNLASTIEFRLGRCSDPIDEMKLFGHGRLPGDWASAPGGASLRRPHPRQGRCQSDARHSSPRGSH